MAESNGRSQDDLTAGSHSVSISADSVQDPGTARLDRQLREIESAILSDGSIVDLVADAQTPGSVRLVIWKGGSGQVVSSWAHDGRLLVPTKIDVSVMAGLRLPRSLAPCSDVRDLFRRIQSRAQEYVSMRPQHAFLVTAFALSTWFADRLPVVPYLFIYGPPGAGKSTLLRFLHCVCRRSLHAGGITRASLYSLADLLGPSLLIDESEFAGDKHSRDLLRLLRNGNRQGAQEFCNRRAYQTCCPKAFACRYPIKDAALSCRGVDISLFPTTDLLPVLDAEAEALLAGEFQPQLETFRLSQYHRVGSGNGLDLQQLTPKMRDMARALAAPILGDRELLEELTALLRELDYDARINRFAEPEWVVMLALYQECHTFARDLFVGNIAAKACQILREYGLSAFESVQQVGGILRSSLGMRIKRVGKGYRLRLDVPTVRQIHAQAKAVGINRSDIIDDQAVQLGNGGPPCLMCEEFELMRDHDGNPLRSIELSPPLPQSHQSPFGSIRNRFNRFPTGR